MNNEQQTWILRKPINVEFLDDVPGGRYVTDLEIMGRDDYMWNEAQFDEEHFKAQFQPLDIDDIRKQIADIMTFYRTLVNGWAETGAGADDLPETALEESIDAILDVTLGRKQ